MLLVLFLQNNSHAQDCEKKISFDKETAKTYDFKSQSTYTRASTSDTIKLKSVIYSKHNYKISVKGDRRFGKIQYKIYLPEKRFEATPDTIIEREVIQYKRDAHGFIIYGEDEEPIPTGTVTMPDTVWARNIKTTEKLVFDNIISEDQYWEIKANKTEIIMVEIIIPNAKKHHYGCVGLMIGRQQFIPN